MAHPLGQGTARACQGVCWAWSEQCLACQATRSSRPSPCHRAACRHPTLQLLQARRGAQQRRQLLPELRYPAGGGAKPDCVRLSRRAEVVPCWQRSSSTAQPVSQPTEEQFYSVSGAHEEQEARGAARQHSLGVTGPPFWLQKRAAGRRGLGQRARGGQGGRRGICGKCCGGWDGARRAIVVESPLEKPCKEDRGIRHCKGCLGCDVLAHCMRIA